MSLGTCTAKAPVVNEERERIVYLEELNRALMESLERVESLFDFVGQNDVTVETDQILASLFSEARNMIKVQGIALALVNPVNFQFKINRVVPQRKKSWVRREMKAQIECGIFSWVLRLCSCHCTRILTW